MNFWTLYICKDLNCPHYQMSINEINKKSSYMNSIPHLYYSRSSNSFIHYVFQYHEMKVSDTFVTSLVNLVKSKYDKKSKYKARQRMYLDFGFTTNISTSRYYENSKGIAKPLLKPGSCLPIVVKCFIILSNIARNELCPWIVDSQIYSDDRFPQRFKEFANTIHNTNMIEAIRIALVDCNNQCSIHEDKHNDPYPKMSSVISLGKVIHQDDGGVSRLSIIGYSRKSISDYYLRKKKILPSITRLLTYHIQKENKLSYSYIRQSNGLYVKEFHGYLHPYREMNMPINIILSYIERYRLGYTDVVSILQAYIFTYSDTRIFSQVAQYLLESDAINTCTTRSLNDIGFQIISLIQRKYGKYNILYGSMTNETYRRLVQLLCCHFFNLFKHITFQSSKKKRHSLVIRVKRDIETMYQKYNVHISDCPFLFIAAIIGIVPFWIIYEYEGISKRNIFEDLLKLDSIIYDKTTCNQIIESLRYVIQQKEGRIVNTLYLLCLAEDYILNNDLNQNIGIKLHANYKKLRYIYSIHAGGMVVRDRKKKVSISLNSSFISDWPYHKALHPITSILSAFDIETFKNVNEELFTLKDFSYLFTILRSKCYSKCYF